MKRIIAAVVGTITVLGGLFSYRTSLGQGVVASPAEPARIIGPATAGASAAAPGAPGGTPADAVASTPSDSSAATAPETPENPPTTTASTGAQSPASSASSPAMQVLGAVEQTAYGPVQVELTIESGVITDATAVQYPTAERRSQEINSYALPQLRSELLASQSATIDGVSGATYTTEGYQASVQSALDAAHRAA